MTHALAFLGFGNVGRALARLLGARRDALREQYGIEYRVTGVASRTGGWVANASGLEPFAPAGTRCEHITDWLALARPSVVFESIPLDPGAGQPALAYLRAALEAGAHAVSANKGPVVHGYAELTRLAASVGRRYLFESAVADGAPVFSLVRRCLPLAGLRAVSGVFTSTATVVLEAVEDGLTLADGVARAQRLGVAEADPSYDVDGWDSAVKLCAIANVLLGAALRPADVEREGIRTLDPALVRDARAAGAPYRLVGRVEAGGGAGGGATARVVPEQVDTLGPLGAARGTTLVMHYEAAMFPGGLTVTSRDPDLTTTAYGMLADFLEAVGAT